jgi:DNA polymerase-1
MSKRPIFLLFDGHAVIYRAFYALPKLTDPQGRVVNAAYGFSRILLAAINEFKPKYLAVTFDHHKPTFRHKEFEDYKAQRPEMPDELQPQIPLVKEIVKVLNIPQFEIEGYEADDLIGTLSYKLDHNPQELKADKKLLSIVVTGDKDLFQLVDDNTHVWLPGRGRKKDTEYDREKVIQDLGVKPEQVVDMKALMGDPSDNIPGIKGIGQKTAVKLLNEYFTLENLFKAVDKINLGSVETSGLLRGALLTKLQGGKEVALLSKKLAKIDQDVPLNIDLSQCRVESYDKAKVVDLFKELDFNSLVTQLPGDQFEVDVQQALF